MKYILCLLLVLMTADLASAQSDTVRIRTSAQCGTCRQKLNRDLGYVKGVQSVQLDLETQLLTVAYDQSRTNPEKIRKAVTHAGYDADDMPADPRAYHRLPACCKKGGHPRE
jgi:copper chaperone CopZ